MCLNTWSSVGETVWEELGGVSMGTGYAVSEDLPVSFSVLWLCLKMRALSYCSSTMPTCLLPACLPACIYLSICNAGRSNGVMT